MTKVLLVDDDPDIVALAEELLTIGGLEVIGKTTAPEALDFLRSGAKVDAIACDYMMPGMNGLEFFRVIQRDRLFVGTFVVITGFPDKISELEANLGKGIDRIFLKPVEFYEIARFLKHQAAG